MGIKVNVILFGQKQDHDFKFFHNYEESHNTSVIRQQMQAMRGNGGNKSLYSAEMLVRASSYFLISRSPYQKTRKDHGGRM